MPPLPQAEPLDFARFGAHLATNYVPNTVIGGPGGAEGGRGGPPLNLSLPSLLPPRSQHSHSPAGHAALDPPSRPCPPLPAPAHPPPPCPPLALLCCSGLHRVGRAERALPRVDAGGHPHHHAQQEDELGAARVGGSGGLWGSFLFPWLGMRFYPERCVSCGTARCLLPPAWCALPPGLPVPPPTHRSRLPIGPSRPAPLLPQALHRAAPPPARVVYPLLLRGHRGRGAAHPLHAAG